MTPVRTWDSMRARIHAQLERQTGAGVEEWNARVRAAGLEGEDALRVWLAGQGVTGYPQNLLVWEALGYPDFLVASAEELIEAQYGDRPALRPILDAVLAAGGALGDVDVQARKTYVTLVTPRRTFAVVQATTKRRVDLGLRLDGAGPGGRLLDAKGVGNDAINLRIALETVGDFDHEALELLRRACDESR